ncbi:MAG: hypothetical protein ACE37F_09025 [Nannocystaceae bacterium]|nr:hypothetical protein [bacterium]
MRLTRLLLISCLFPLACTAPVGVTGPSTVPADGVAQCDAQCGTMGLQTTAVVVMAGRIGCVCERAGSAARTGEESAGLAGGMAAIVQQEEQQQASAAAAAAP